VPQLQGTNFYTSHEALLLPYEEALTRQDLLTGKWYDTSAHMLWIGDAPASKARPMSSSCAAWTIRSAQVRTEPAPDADQAARRSQPGARAGAITLISRFGHDKVESGLPPLVRAVAREGHPVVWSCDPMHGNVIKADNGYKTRPFERILSEVKGFFAVHRAEGTHAGGIHIEMTGRDVTECTGGAVAITQEGLADRYHTHCDPRLNAAQSIELAFLLAEAINEERAEVKAEAA
jgi:3-deoxy-7-phosphoheptulonate synthase